MQIQIVYPPRLSYSSRQRAGIDIKIRFGQQNRYRLYLIKYKTKGLNYMSKIRLDVYLADKGLFESRERAKAAIMAGQVYIDNQKCDKAGQQVDENASDIEVRGGTMKYVSRGGLKLEKAMSEFPISLAGKTAMDIGASTGGFTDCMLQNGAKKVFSVDVGYGQFAWKLRQDKRVVNMERTNIRYVTPEQIGEPIDFASIDVSFISLRLVLPVAYSLLGSRGELVALIKPQFEAGRGQVGKKGVVRDIKIHREVIENVLSFARETGFYPAGLSYSPIKGPEGNIEYLAYLKKEPCQDAVTDETVAQITASSHERLK